MWLLDVKTLLELLVLALTFQTWRCNVRFGTNFARPTSSRLCCETQLQPLDDIRSCIFIFIHTRYQAMENRIANSLWYLMLSPTTRHVHGLPPRPTARLQIQYSSIL